MARWLFALLLSGCSTVMARGAHTTPAGDRVCSSSYVGPAIDTALAAGGAAIVAASQLVDDERTARDAMLAGTTALIVFGISAIHGYSTVEQCEEATRDGS